MWIEYFGTLASVVVAISLTMKNIRRLRIINGIGAAGFAVYGAYISAWPVLALNAFILVIDIWYLARMRNEDEKFDFLEVNGLKSAYVRKFIDFHLDDILTFQPDFNHDDTDGVKGCLILRDVRPVAIVLYRESDEGSARILLDYSVPSYRDFANARYFFDYVLRKVDLGSVSRLISGGGSRLHRSYLEKVGFRPVGVTGYSAIYERLVESPSA